MSCDHCRKVWATFNKEPDCYDCEPETMPENFDAIQVYTLVKNQHIIDFGRPIDINLPAVQFAFDLCKIKNRMKCFKKVYMLYHRNLKSILEESEN